MNKEMIFSSLALTIHLVAFAIWTSLFRRLEHRIWLTVWLGFLLLFVHRLAETFDLFILGHATAMLFSLFGLAASIQTGILVKRHAKSEKRLAELHDRLAQINTVPPNEGVAAQLAEIIVDMKEQLAYYRSKADEVGIPRYSKDGGTDRTRTG